MVSDKLLAQIQKVTAKRPRTILDHILEHGYITTDEIKELYGYNHPPRAARDVREWGIPLKMVRVTINGRRLASYRLDTDAEIDETKTGGRRAFPKALKKTLVERQGQRCALCGASFHARALQIDHRVPYEVAGDSEGRSPDEFMLVCGSCNRAKSFDCEHCVNWSELRDVEICRSCYRASPDDYRHIAMDQRRRLTINWQGEETREYDALEAEATRRGQHVSDYAKDRLRKRR